MDRVECRDCGDSEAERLENGFLSCTTCGSTKITIHMERTIEFEVED